MRDTSFFICIHWKLYKCGSFKSRIIQTIPWPQNLHWKTCKRRAKKVKKKKSLRKRNSQNWRKLQSTQSQKRGKKPHRYLCFYTFLSIVLGWHFQGAPCPQHTPVLLFLAGAAGPTTGAQSPTWTPQISSPNTLSRSARPRPQNSKWELEKSKPSTNSSHSSRYF